MEAILIFSFFSFFLFLFFHFFEFSRCVEFKMRVWEVRGIQNESFDPWTRCVEFKMRVWEVRGIQNESFDPWIFKTFYQNSVITFDICVQIGRELSQIA